MKIWLCLLSVAVLGLTVTLVLETRELKNGQEQNRRMQNELAEVMLEAVREQNERNEEYDQGGKLLLRHNKLLIANVKSGRLDKPVHAD